MADPAKRSPPGGVGVPLGPEDDDEAAGGAGDALEVPELRELEPRAPGPSGTSDTEFDLEVLTAEGVEAPDIGGSPSMDKLCVRSINEESLAVEVDPDRAEAEGGAVSSWLIWTRGW